MLMLFLLLASAVPCKATTDIKEFKKSVETVCETPCPDGGCLKAVEFNGNHDKARFLLTYVDSWKGKQIADTPTGVQAQSLAVEANRLIQEVYPMASFEFAIRDSSYDGDVCSFWFVSGRMSPVSGRCLMVVP